MTDDCFAKAIINRRSIYQLGKDEILSSDEITEIVNTACLLYTSDAADEQRSG